MNNIYLTIQGRADDSLIKKYDVNNVFSDVLKDKSVLIFVVNYSECDIPLGQIFNFLTLPNKQSIVLKSELIVISIFQKSIDVLSSGLKAIVAVKFIDKEIDFNLFPVVNEFRGTQNFIYLSTELMNQVR